MSSMKNGDNAWYSEKRPHNVSTSEAVNTVCYREKVKQIRQRTHKAKPYPQH